MPELPEVETVCRGLGPHLEGRRVARVDVRRRDLRVPLAADFEQELEGARVQAVRRRAKYILCATDRGSLWVTHLGMSGRMLYHAPGVEVAPQKHDHLLLTLEDGARLVFNDARRFGFSGLVGEAEMHVHPWFSHLGVEPLEEAFSAAYLLAGAEGRRQPVKNFIMDQRVVVGVGNIYASEALYHAKIRPDRPACEVTDAEAARLVAAIREVLAAAIASGGSTLRDYVRSSGDVGSFQHRFTVYGRDGTSCACGGCIRRVVLGGRASFYCPDCQV